MTWEEIVLVIAWFGVFVWALCLAVQAKRAETAPDKLEGETVAFCDYEKCPLLATVTMDINGRIFRSCEEHVAPVVRDAIDPSFEAFGVAV